MVMGIVTKSLAALGSGGIGIATKAFDLTSDSIRSGTRHNLTYSYDWGREQGLSGDSLVYACITAVAQAVSVAQPIVRQPSPDGKGEPLPFHPLVDLLQAPNKWETWEEFIQLTIVHRSIAGNAYWWIGRDEFGDVVELKIVRPDWVMPKVDANSNDFISYYELNMDGKRYRIPLADMVHHRNLRDPANPRLGLPPLSAIMREIGLDGMATEHVTALLDNYAMPALHLKVKKSIRNQAHADTIKANLMAKMGGPRRGEPLVTDDDTEITALGVTAQQMELPDLRDVAETRICMAFGVPPIVVGANVGLKRGTYSNYEQAQKAFYENTVLQILREIRSKIREQLQPNYEQVGNAGSRIDFGWDLADMQALAPDEEKIFRRNLDAFSRGAITRNQFLQAIGDGDVEDGDYYLIPTSTKERKEGEFPEPIAPVMAPPGQLPGTGLRALPPPATGTNGPKA